jgi:hypothetical protein
VRCFICSDPCPKLLRLTASKRGWAVTLAGVLYGWVQATADAGWRAIDVEGRVRVKHRVNRRMAAADLFELVAGWQTERDPAIVTESELRLLDGNR